MWLRLCCIIQISSENRRVVLNFIVHLLIFYYISLFAGFYIPFIYLPDNAILKGHPRDQAAFLLSIIGIANTVGR